MEELPRKLNKREAKITPKVMQWFLNNYPDDVAVEIKYGKNKLKTHQLTALSMVSQGKFIHKLPDMGKIQPFDFFMLKNAHAFVVICDGNKCIGTRLNDGKLIHIDL